jgi:hypothetical protein
MKTYNEVNGTSYHIETPKEVIDVLESARENRTRIIVDFGDVKTGKSWNESFDIAGYVGRSTGTSKIPLLVHNARSMGGGGLLDHCIVKIVTSKGKRVLYQHKEYNK